MRTPFEMLLSWLELVLWLFVPAILLGRYEWFLTPLVAQSAAYDWLSLPPVMVIIAYFCVAAGVYWLGQQWTHRRLPATASPLTGMSRRVQHRVVIWQILSFLSLFLLLFFASWRAAWLIVGAAAMQGLCWILSDLGGRPILPWMNFLSSRMKLPTMARVLIVILMPLLLSSLARLVGIEVVWLLGGLGALSALLLILVHSELAQLQSQENELGVTSPALYRLGEGAWWWYVVGIVTPPDQNGFLYGLILFLIFMMTTFIPVPSLSPRNQRWGAALTLIISFIAKLTHPGLLGIILITVIDGIMAQVFWGTRLRPRGTVHASVQLVIVSIVMLSGFFYPSLIWMLLFGGAAVSVAVNLFSE
ncbi:MAG TPA: hypothetical protein VD999_02540 [Vitreimonas sp.]|nr:hypothetical protein [Vitreimonas sp.]